MANILHHPLNEIRSAVDQFDVTLLFEKTGSYAFFLYLARPMKISSRIKAKKITTMIIITINTFIPALLSVVKVVCPNSGNLIID